MKDTLQLLEVASSADRQERRSQLRDFKYMRSASRNEVIQAVRGWWEAWFRGDPEALTTLTCERYVEFGRDGEIWVAGKTALMEQARNRGGAFEIFEWAIINPRVRHLEDAAVCKYHFWVAGTLHNTRIKKEGLVADVLVEVGGMWKLVAHHGVFSTGFDPVALQNSTGVQAGAITEAASGWPLPKNGGFVTLRG